MGANREKELLYSMLESITKERNELMQFIMNKIDRMDDIEDYNIQHKEVEVETATPVSDIVEEPTIEEIKVEQSETIEEEKSIPTEIVEDIDNTKDSADDNGNIVELNLFTQSELEQIDEVKQEEIKEEIIEPVEEIVEVVDDDGDKEEVVEEKDIKEAVEEKADEVPEKSMKEIIDEHNKSLGLKDASEIQKGASIIPKVEIEREKDRLPRRPANANIDRVNGIIVSMLKKLNKPVHVKDIHINLNKRLKANDEGEVNVTNLRNNILPRIMKSNKNIQRVTRGYYQYVPK